MNFTDLGAVSINPKQVCNTEYTFTRGNDQSKIRIIKEESNELSYKISVIYSGIKNNRPDWIVEINDKQPRFGAYNLLTFSGSKEFAFKPADEETIEIKETDENGTCSLWISPSKDGYEAHESFTKVSDKIKELVEKGKIFQTLDTKQVRKIFYSESAGVFLYATDNAGHASIYHSKESNEFSKCESNKISQCRCPAGDSKWEVKLPTELPPRILEFPQGVENVQGHGNHVAWDKAALKRITL